jgi:diguanylate cyclase (GGDEF)-like protein
MGATQPESEQRVSAPGRPREDTLADVRTTAPAERLLEDSWEARAHGAGRRELIVEATAAALFGACAVPMAVFALGAHHIDVALAVLLVALYALVSRMIKFPIGAGYVVPSYLVLVPMLLLLPPGVVPLLTATGLVLGTTGQVAAGRARPRRILFSVPDAWHALGPAAVLLVGAGPDRQLPLALLYACAFLAGCLLDLASATVRESAILGVRPQLQLRVVSRVWLVDACIAPLGLLVADAARHAPLEVLLIIPLNALMVVLARDRNRRIEQAQRRLDAVAHERSRLQAAVGRLGDALAAKLDLRALSDIVLRGSIEAVDADAGRFSVCGPQGEHAVEIAGTQGPLAALDAAAAQARDAEGPCQVERDGAWALSLPFVLSGRGGLARGALTVARADRAFRSDERTVLLGLVERARLAAADITAHQVLREQALTDSLTNLGNRHKLAADAQKLLRQAGPSEPLLLILFDLNGFKSYNDTFGHPAGDAMLQRLGAKLRDAVAPWGCGYRLGGDEFCVLLNVEAPQLASAIAAGAGALDEHGANFAVSASYGAVLLPYEADSLEYALQLADERMYQRKRGRPSVVRDQTRDVLMRIMQAKQPSLHEHSGEVTRLCMRVGRRFSMSAEECDELMRGAELHDVGKVGIPDAVLEKPGPLNESDWEFMRQHTLLGERILNAAPALRPVAVIVRATHERWDGLGYPDGLAGEAIPLAARIIAACDAYEAMTTDRCYRGRQDPAAAREELRRCAGRQFDPQVVEVLLDELAREAGITHSAAGVLEQSARTAEEVAEELRKVLVGVGGAQPDVAHQQS